MRRIILLAMTLLLCMTMVLPVCAQKQEFVPSITYKDGVTSVKAEMNGEKVDACIVITPIKYAMEKTTDITQPARELLLETYEKLEKGTMKLPLEKDYVIVELVDISFARNACEEHSGHDHHEWLQEDGNAITIEMGNLSKGMDLIVFTYNDGQWTQVEKWSTTVTVPILVCSSIFVPWYSVWKQVPWRRFPLLVRPVMCSCGWL